MAAATISKLVLSGSTDGRNIKVAATSSTGTTIHTGSTDTDNIDEIWLYATNTSTSAVKLTLEWGNTTSPDDLIEVTIPPEQGLTKIVEGLPIKGNASALVVTAFAATANVININGFVNRIAS
jgi:hypothetical protein